MREKGVGEGGERMREKGMEIGGREGMIREERQWRGGGGRLSEKDSERRVEEGGGSERGTGKVLEP